MRTARGVVIEFAELSDPGRDPGKQLNEDSSGSADTQCGFLAVVCDGMGGHADGKEASELALQTIIEHVESAPKDSAQAQVLGEAIHRAARAVFEMGGRAPLGVRPGSTCVATLIHEQGAEIAHVGDSRLYLVRSNAIQRHTRDHSMVQEMVDAGFLEAQAAHRHPDANRITRALGMLPDVEVEVRPEPVPLQRGDVLLLCSDGLTDMLNDSEILELVNASMYGGPAFCCQRLIERANERGGHDNVTVQLIQIMERAGRRPADPTQVDLEAEEELPAGATLPMPAGPPTITESSPYAAPTLIDFKPPPQKTDPALDVTAPQRGSLPRFDLIPRMVRRSGHRLFLLYVALAAAIVLGIVLWWAFGGRRQQDVDSVVPPPSAPAEPPQAPSTELVPEPPPPELALDAGVGDASLKLKRPRVRDADAVPNGR
jgi:serine/threonine protein phosphatase PrpC